MRKGGQVAGKAAQMRPAWEHFAAGDVVAARRAALQVLSQPATPEDAAEARDLLERTRPPRQVYLFGLLAAALITGLILVAIFRT